MKKDYLAIVTGGAQGIGFTITEALLKAEGKVHFLDISEEAGLKAQKELGEKYGDGRAKFVQCDVSKKDQLEKAFYHSKEELGGLNVVCNNAGINEVAAERTFWEEMIAINLAATIHGCLLGLDVMDTGNGGSGGVIINTASLAGLPPLFAATPVYGTTKAGVIAFSRRAALTSMEKGIRINCICPGPVDTKMFAENVKDLREMKLLGTTIPFTEDGLHASKMAPSEVADEVVKLIEDETKNGEALVITKDKGVYFHNFSS